MGDRTGIEWTDATWNPVTGCTKVSAGCDHCYAETLAERFRGTEGHYYERGFDVVLRPEKLDQPLRWTRPRMVFVNSMSDLFHDAVPTPFIVQVFAVMALAEHHTFQVLTKRHGRMRSLLSSTDFWRSVRYATIDRAGHEDAPGGPALPNVWIGVSAENQQWADVRIPALLATPAAIRWISAEPLLDQLDLSRWLGVEHYDSFGWGQEMFAVLNDRVGPAGGLHWVVAGGESGRGARPMHPYWPRQLRDQCAAAGTPFLFKQWGDLVTEDQSPEDVVLPASATRLLGRDEPSFYRVGKKAAGRELDGVIHDGYPAVVSRG